MARATVVQLPFDEPPCFPDRCVVCGAERPGQARRCVGRWAFGLLRRAVEVPMCAGCALGLAAREHARSFRTLVAVAVAASVALGLVPTLGPARPEDVLGKGGLFLVLMLPVWTWQAIRPLPFALRVTPERVGYAFTDPGLAAAFRAANPVLPGAGARARARGGVVVLLAATVGLGLLSRRQPLPGLLAEYTGDALYATAACWLFVLLRPAASTAGLGLVGLCFAAAVEASQLLTWPWLGELRATRVGALLLGQGFQLADLFAYGVGALLACLADVTFLRRSRLPRPRPDRLPHQPTGRRA